MCRSSIAGSAGRVARTTLGILCAAAGSNLVLASSTRGTGLADSIRSRRWCRYLKGACDTGAYPLTIGLAWAVLVSGGTVTGLTDPVISRRGRHRLFEPRWTDRPPGRTATSTKSGRKCPRWASRTHPTHRHSTKRVSPGGFADSEADRQRKKPETRARIHKRRRTGHSYASAEMRTADRYRASKRDCGVCTRFACGFQRTDRCLTDTAGTGCPLLTFRPRTSTAPLRTWSTTDTTARWQQTKTFLKHTESTHGWFWWTLGWRQTFRLGSCVLVHMCGKRRRGLAKRKLSRH